MDRIKPIEALHVAGSIASVTGITLLAIGSKTDDLEFASILAYSMSASIFLGVLAFIVYGFRFLYPKIEYNAGKGVAVASSAVAIPLAVWASFYFILLLKSLAKYEFLWLLEQVAK